MRHQVSERTVRGFAGAVDTGAAAYARIANNAQRIGQTGIRGRNVNENDVVEAERVTGK